ncbi:tripartite tricarboxylate transporter TctB family protein [Alcaligenaceae bacterium]|nr:tripartite tricarboxylate transporter TctB family protein [Alcaligenaceae bacterium]
MKLTNRRELYSAGFMLVVGIGTTLGSLNYPLGEVQSMGPGYYPLLLGVVLTVLGALTIATPLTSHDKGTKSIWRGNPRAWAAVTVGIGAFIVVGHYGGFVPAAFVLVGIAALGDPKNTLKSAFVLGLSVTIVAVLVFHYGMRMQFPLFQWG